jgi:4-hydroxyphenylpyruvate dioxygenase-like putative hemolysin
MTLYFLYENAAGYAIFEKLEFDETSTTLKQVQKSIETFDHFSKMIKLKSFKSFAGNEQALSNLRSLAESEISEDLQALLESILSKSKAAKVQFAVLDKTLANKIGETFGVQIRVSDAIFEIFRGLRLHFTKFIKKQGNHPFIFGLSYNVI